MRKIVKLIIIIICFVSQSFIANSPILLNAQPGWSEDQRLVQGFVLCWDPKAVCCGDTVHLVWWQHYAHDEIFYKRSTDAGATWEEDFLLTSEDSISAVTPSIAVSESNIHVAWKETYAYYYAICYRKSVDGGDTWSEVDTLHKTNMEGMRGNPRLCVYKDTVCLVTTRDDGKVLFAKSIDNGISWDSAVVIGEGRAHPSFKMSKSTSSYLALSVAASIVTEILFYKSTDAGITWSRGQFVSDNDGIGSQRPAMDIDDSTGLHITWYDYKYSPYPWTGDIFYRASRDSGNSWENIDSLTVVHRATVSDILAEGSNLHLVWQDDRHEFAENREIYYRTSSDLGQTWGAEVRLTDAPYHSMRPSLACGGGYLHLFWQDRRNYGNNSAGPLYYKRKDLSHSIAESNKSVSVTNCRCKLFPNPFSQILCIEHNTSAEQLKIKIFDVSGKEVTNYKTNDNTGEIKVDTKDLPCGVYFVKIEADGEKVIRKVVKIE